MARWRQTRLTRWVAAAWLRVRADLKPFRRCLPSRREIPAVLVAALVISFGWTLIAGQLADRATDRYRYWPVQAVTSSNQLVTMHTTPFSELYYREARKLHPDFDPKLWHVPVIELPAWALVGEGARAYGWPVLTFRHDFATGRVSLLWQGVFVSTLLFFVPAAALATVLGKLLDALRGAASAMLSSNRAMRRRERGLCPQCAYDMRGLYGGSRCPECGEPA